jgi:peroxiredoxin Q/BCP
MNTRFNLLFSVVPLFVLVVGCQTKDGAPSTASSTSATTTPASSVTSTSADNNITLKEGDAAPDVDMALQDGRHQKLSALRGQMVVVYFYPKDQTPGCTVEAENFRDRFDDLKKAGVAVIGVSTQDAASHKAFIEKEKLPFDLAIDDDKSIAKAFGVPVGTSGMHARQTFLISKDGKIKKVWRDVTPKDHANAVLTAAAAS